MIKLEVHLPFDLKPLRFKGEIRWCQFLMHQKGPDLFQVGVKLLAGTEKDKDRFIGFVTEKGLVYARKKVR